MERNLRHSELDMNRAYLRRSCDLIFAVACVAIEEKLVVPAPKQSGHQSMLHH